MINPLYITIIMIGIIGDCNQYEFEREELVLSPWEINGDNASQVIQDLGDEYQADIDTLIYQNRHVDNSYDTLFIINALNSKIEVFKTASESWINKTELNDDLLKLKIGLQIGSSRAEFLSKFEEIDTKNRNCESYKITGLGGVSWIDIYFANDTLSRICYSGYND